MFKIGVLMKYLKITKWDTWQTFRKDRGTPGWIKVWRNLFSKPDWAALTDQEKGQLISMWLAAADNSGKIPNDPKIVQKICHLDQPPDLHRFKALGWLDGQLTDTCQPPMVGDRPANGRQAGTQEKRREENKNTLGISANAQKEWFEEIWNLYPRKLKRAVAYDRFKKNIKTIEDFENIKLALPNYIKDTEHQRQNGHPDLAWQHGSTWFHKNWRDYVDLKQSDKAQPKPPGGSDWKKQFAGERVAPEKTKKFIKDFTDGLK